MRDLAKFGKTHRRRDGVALNLESNLGRRDGVALNLESNLGRRDGAALNLDTRAGFGALAMIRYYAQ